MRVQPTTRQLVILGSTGSIGRQTLEIVEYHKDRFSILGLAAGANFDLLSEQVRRFRPKLVYLSELDGSKRSALAALGCKIVSMEEMACLPEAELVVVATGGKAGLAPLLAAIRARKRVALANKEPLVIAGHIVTREAQRSGVEILPIDSEHSAIWQCLRGEMARVPGSLPTISRLILTASGGAFRDRKPEDLPSVTPEEALAHPTWLMGKKITIDSATLMNKGLEVIEAHWLFGVPYDRIEIVLHRESIVHSLVEFVDGSVKAQLSLPDMRIPIQYALGYPDRLPNDLPRLDLARAGSLSFGPVDLDRYPCLKLALQAARRGGTFPAVLSAADEEAVDLFLSRKIRFTDIAILVERVLDVHRGVSAPDLQDILVADQWAREECIRLAGRRA